MNILVTNVTNCAKIWSVHTGVSASMASDCRQTRKHVGVRDIEKSER